MSFLVFFSPSFTASSESRLLGDVCFSCNVLQSVLEEFIFGWGVSSLVECTRDGVSDEDDEGVLKLAQTNLGVRGVVGDSINILSFEGRL